MRIVKTQLFSIKLFKAADEKFFFFLHGFYFSLAPRFSFLLTVSLATSLTYHPHALSLSLFLSTQLLPPFYFPQLPFAFVSPAAVAVVSAFTAARRPFSYSAASSTSDLSHAVPQTWSQNVV